jgi:hypothetical protein
MTVVVFNNISYLDDNTVEIYLNDQEILRLDTEDLPILLTTPWYTGASRAGGYCYVKTTYGADGRKGQTRYLHREIVVTDLQVDHINGDTLDNRRCNLRPVTASQNTLNSKMPCNNTTGYKGVRSTAHGRPTRPTSHLFETLKTPNTFTMGRHQDEHTGQDH